ncbi:MAG TPA: hypothetical protein DCL15_20090 [Chloroflexi bacterium]|nr:hypothetical protein [Chloroflexota bacterium]HHW87061.1 hypothetical protein [Chloroflexota bacterium]
MTIRILLAAEDQAFLTLLDRVMAATRPLLAFDVDVQHASTRAAVCARAESRADDIILLDWGMADADTPDLIEYLFRCDANLRVVALLPQDSVQYRSRVWAAGACASIPREHMDQEWLASILCVVHRAMAREARLRNNMDQLIRDRNLHLRRMMEIQEECRRRVARDLHDEVSQSLTAALVQLDTVTALLHQQTEQAAAQITPQIGGLRTTLSRLHEEVQRVLLDLRPVLLEQKGLMAALAWYGNERLRPLGCAVHLSGGDCAPDLPDDVRLTLYRIGQESLSNVARHAAARNVWLDLHCTGDELVLTVRDDGRGFVAKEFAQDDSSLRGVGLLGLQERTWLLNGMVTLTSTPGCGATVEVRIPYTGACCTS